MNSFARRFLRECGDVDGFILKHKSPSCGLRGVKLCHSIDPDTTFVRKGVGLFAAEAIQKRPHTVFKDEERLDDPDFREHFLTRVFTLAAWRAAKGSRAATALQWFHEYHHLLLQAFNQQLERKMDRIVRSSARQMPTSAEIEHYETILLQALHSTPRRRSQAKPFELALEHYAPLLRASDRKRFRMQLDKYLSGDEPLSDVRKTIQIWAVRYDKDFIRRHSFFRPYPGPLAEA